MDRYWIRTNDNTNTIMVENIGIPADTPENAIEKLKKNLIDTINNYCDFTIIYKNEAGLKGDRVAVEAVKKLRKGGVRKL